MTYAGPVFNPTGEIAQFASSVGDYISTVTHLSNSHGTGQARQGLDYNSYHDYNDYHDYYSQPVPPTDALIAPPSTTSPYSSQKWSRYERRDLPRPDTAPYYLSFTPPRPLDPPKNYVERRVDGLASIAASTTISLTRFLPLLAALPVVGGLAYILVEENGPTPVVKERSYASDREPRMMDILTKISATKSENIRHLAIPSDGNG